MLFRSGTGSEARDLAELNEKLLTACITSRNRTISGRTMTVGEAFNLIRAVADPWPNAFLRAGAGELQVAWALPTSLPCASGGFRLTPEGTLLGFADGALMLHALQKGSLRSERPTEHRAWLSDIGIPEFSL